MAQVSQKVQQERLWATLAQLSGFLGFIIPFGNIIAPLLIWLIKKDESKFIDTSSKEAINFQITVTIYYVICIALFFILIGFVILPILVIFEIIVMIQAAVKVNNGGSYSYPLTLRFIQ